MGNIILGIGIVIRTIRDFLVVGAPWLAGLAALTLLWAFGRQHQHPSGWFGRVFMAWRFNRGNRSQITAALVYLSPRPGERIADIGFGGGYSLQELIAAVRPAHPIGIDVSEMMVDRAGELWDEAVELYLAAADHLPLSSGSLDGVLTVNTIYFWRDPVAAFKEIRRVLKPEGRVVVGVRKPWAMRLKPVVWFRYRLYSEARLRAILEQAGFETQIIEDGGCLFAVAKPLRESAQPATPLLP